MRRFGITSVVAITALAALIPAARAGSTWDANEPRRRLDLRWVGVVAQQDERFRVTVTFHHRVKLRWFDDHSGVVVEFTHDREIAPYWFFEFTKSPKNRLHARLCEGGSGCGPFVRVRRPDMSTIRAWLRPMFDQPQLGWRFRTRSFVNGLSNTRDRTRWGTI